MKTKFYLEGKKTTKKKAMTLISNEQLKGAFEDFLKDPLQQQSWYTKEGSLIVEFGI